MSKRFMVLILAFTIILAGLSGCHMKQRQTKGAEYPVAINHIEIKKAPQKVAVLSPSLAEIINDMGYGEVLCGRSIECDYPDTVAALPDAGSMLSPSVDVLKSWNLDLLMMQSEPSESLKSQLETAKLTYVVIPPASSFDGLKDIYTTVGRIFSGAVSGEEKGSQQMAKLTNELDSLHQKVSSKAAEKPQKAIYITDTFRHEATGDTVLSRLLTSAGFINAAQDASGWAATDEQVTSADIVFCPDTLIEKLKTSLADIPAVKNQQIYGISAATMESQSLRMVSAAEAMAKAVYPDALESDETNQSQSTTE